MAKNFMYKRINIFLLVLMCIIVVGLAGSAIYFQQSFKELSTNYQSVQSNFTTCQNVLDDKEQKLASCVEDLNSTAQDIGKYDTLYEQKVQELQSTKNELQRTDKELKETINELRSTEQEAEDALAEQRRLQDQLQQRKQEIQNLEAEIDNLEDDLEACQDAG
jgi:chromosome segregation ATPase